MKRVIYPGTFDPIHNGHIDIAERASKLFDELIFLVAENQQKQALFSAQERKGMITDATKHIPNVVIMSTQDLVVNIARQEKAIALIRGLRHVSDFEFEFQMAMMNYHLNPEVTTVLMMPDEKFIHLNSTVVKNVAKLKGDIRDYVPAIVERYLNLKFHSR
ncbi:MAG: pantetheine-phosphate adenylyltransferase [Fidelibacterota bacterium]